MQIACYTGHLGLFCHHILPCVQSHELIEVSCAIFMQLIKPQRASVQAVYELCGHVYLNPRVQHDVVDLR
jgi:hypothetical protein